MKNFKDFLVTEEVSPKGDEFLLPEGFVFCEEPELVGNITEAKSGDLPAVLIMRRVAIRQYPNNQKIALYKVDKIERYITIPYGEPDHILNVAGE
jgi:hypothetical protein